jgi:hypothetical protein
MSIRRLSVAVLLPACLALISQPAGAQDYSYARVVRLSLVDGSVQVLRPEAEGWEDGLVNLPIRQGYTISTAYGRAEIEFESGATARLAEHSTLEFTELALADGNRLTRMLLQRGTATFYANLSRNDVFEVSTPHLSLDVPGNARFRVDALDWGTMVSTLKGEVNVNSSAGPYRVTKGQTLTFNPGAAEPALLTRNRELDDWDRWVAGREETITTASSNSLQYVNSSVRYGLADLSNYGGWFFDASHGYVWQPWGYSGGWSPYLQGRWMYVNSVGWTWVSFEPWGWLPYHYGRWILTHRGWAWIPGGFGRWHPGLVAWVNYGNFIGWCPLGPRDRPGIRPRNPQGGVVIINTPNGAVGGAPNNVANVNSNNRPQFVDDSPLPHNPRGFVDDGRFEKNPHIQRGLDNADAAGNATVPSAGATMGARPQTPEGTPGIVYDPDEKRFVNNPNAPARPDPRDSDRPAGVFGRPMRPAESGGTSVSPSEPRSETPATRPQTNSTSSPPSGPQSGWSSRPQPPRAEPRPTAPPRSETSRPQPPRTESPRPSPPPRTETPRPSPPPRAESPRPSGGMGIGGAPRERPSPPPRTEAPRPRPPKD